MAAPVGNILDTTSCYEHYKFQETHGLLVTMLQCIKKWELRYKFSCFVKDVVDYLLNSHNFIPKQALELLHSQVVLG
jgi:hypothetical protein